MEKFGDLTPSQVVDRMRQASEDMQEMLDSMKKIYSFIQFQKKSTDDIIHSQIEKINE